MSRSPNTARRGALAGLLAASLLGITAPAGAAEAWSAPPTTQTSSVTYSAARIATPGATVRHHANSDAAALVVLRNWVWSGSSATAPTVPGSAGPSTLRRGGSTASNSVRGIHVPAGHYAAVVKAGSALQVRGGGTRGTAYRLSSGTHTVFLCKANVPVATCMR